MKTSELVEAVKANNDKLFGNLPEKKAVLLVRGVLQELARQIDSAGEGKLIVQGLGQFVIKQVAGADGGESKRRVVFRRAKPRKAKKSADAADE